MRLIAGPAGRLAEKADLWAGADLIVLASPGAEVPRLKAAARRLELRFHDIGDARPGLIAPGAGLVDEILAFAATASSLAIACYAGVSRSTAAAYAVACQAVGAGQEEELALALRALSPAATPNPLMVALADTALGRGGAMVRAVSAIGRGAEAFEGPAFVWDLDGDARRPPPQV